MPCLVSVLQMSCRARARRGPRSSTSPGSKKVRVLRKRRPSSRVDRALESSEETPLDQLAKVATAVLEAEPKDNSDKRCTKGGALAAQTENVPGRKRKSLRDAGGKIRRAQSPKEMSPQLVTPDVSESPADTSKSSVGQQVEHSGRADVSRSSTADTQSRLGDEHATMHGEGDVIELVEQGRNSTNEASSTMGNTEAGLQEDIVLDKSFQGSSETAVGDGATDSSYMESAVEESVRSTAIDSLVIKGTDLEDTEVQPSEGTTENADISANTQAEMVCLPEVVPDRVSTGVEDALCSNLGGNNATEIVQDASHRPAHLIDHGTMCRKPHSSEPTARVMKSLLTNKHTVQTVNHTSYVTDDQTVKIIYYRGVCPAVQTTIPDHAAYCGKVAPAVETALAVPDHANYSRNVTPMFRTIAPSPAPQPPAVGTRVPLASSQSPQNPTSSHNTPTSANLTDVANPGSKPCFHDGIIHKLKAELAKCTEVQAQRRRKMKVLQQSLRRSKRRNEKLEQLVAELRKRPKPEDSEAVHEKMGKACVDLWKRQELKAKGEALPTEYSSELGTFATTLYDYSPEAYEFVRQTFSGCLPHSRTLMKWKSTSRSADHPSSGNTPCTATDCAVATNGTDQEAVVPVMVFNEGVCLEDVILVQDVDSVTGVDS